MARLWVIFALAALAAFAAAESSFAAGVTLYVARDGNDGWSGTLAAHNQDPQAFIWTAKTQDIIKKVDRARRVLNKVSSD